MLKGSAGQLTIFSHLLAPYRGTFTLLNCPRFHSGYYFSSPLSSFSSILFRGFSCGAVIIMCLTSKDQMFSSGSCWVLLKLYECLCMFCEIYSKYVSLARRKYAKILLNIFDNTPRESTTGISVSVLVLTACWTSAGPAAFWSLTRFTPKTCPIGVEGSLQKRWIVSHMEQKQFVKWNDKLLNALLTTFSYLTWHPISTPNHC